MRSHVESSDAVVFACLAIRDQMKQVYPYLSQIVKSGVPFGILASGTRLRPGELRADLYSFSDEDANLLRQASEQALFWGTRGVLTQQFCKKHGIKNAQFTGDIAFADQRFENRKFESDRNIKRIAVTDPHNPEAYKKPFVALIEQLRKVFPDADVSVFLHGINPTIEGLCKENNIPYKRLYHGNTGLNAYEKVDLHVGFRLHGHVSALSRRIYSYLLEQDGRGTEYGLSIERKISVPCYRYKSSPSSLFPLYRIARKMGYVASHVPLSAIDQVIALVNQDLKEGFDRFNGLEKQIKRFQSANLEMISQLL